MQSRIDKITSPATTPANIKANDALVSPAQLPVFDEEKELRQIKALDALLNNNYANTYPTPRAVRYPQSSPDHYDNVIKELNEAPDRTWAASFVKTIKGALRFS
jgi:cytochrome b pre-mRNA-processing protein 6